MEKQEQKENKQQKKQQAFTEQQDQAYELYLKLEQENFENLQKKEELNQAEKQFIQEYQKKQQLNQKKQEELQKLQQLEQIEEKSKDQEKEFGKLKKKIATDDRKKQDIKYQWVKNNFEEFIKNHKVGQELQKQENSQQLQQNQGNNEKNTKKGEFTVEQEQAYQNYLDNEKRQMELLIQKSEKSKAEEQLIKNYEKQLKDEEKRVIEEKTIKELLELEEKTADQQKQLGKLQKAHKTQDRKKQDMKFKWIQANAGQISQNAQDAPQQKQQQLQLQKQDQQKQQNKENVQKQQDSQQLNLSNKNHDNNNLQKQKSVMFNDQKEQPQKQQPKKGILNQKKGNMMQLRKQASNILPDHLAAPSMLSLQHRKESENYHNNTHYSIVELGLKFSNDIIIGSNQRCIDYLTAVCKVVQDINVIREPGQEEDDERILFCNQFNKYLDELQVQMNSFRSINEGMKTAHNFCKNLTNQLQTSFRDVSKIVSVSKQKDWLCEHIYEFIQIKIKNADQQIISFGLDLIKEGDFIMVYARSMVVEQLLIKKHEQGVKFTVIVVDNSPFFEGKKLVSVLGENGLDCIYTPLSHCSYFIKKVTKVFVGASAMLSNGSCVSRIGTALLSCIANDYRKPFHVFCESYKFSQKSYLDSLSWNELATKSFIQNEDSNKKIGGSKVNLKDISNNGLNPINLRYDLTTCENINMLITEQGKVPPHSVPHIMREFSQQQYIGRIHLPQPDTQ